MNRRKFIRSAASAGGALAGFGLAGGRIAAAQSSSGKGNGQGFQPNILLILADELRYPKVFPNGINDVDGFLKEFMPETYQQLWLKGVKFTNHHSAGIACSPSRGVIVTGLYSQQSWLAQTIASTPTATQSTQPILNPAYPTYGSLLRRAGYQTPYIGKWHLSVPLQDAGGIEAYGFDDMTFPDTPGSNLQGTVGKPPGYPGDQSIENQATEWLSQRAPGQPPWCLTVSFINTHDQEYFPAGTQFQDFTNLFNSSQGTGNLQQMIDYSAVEPTYSYADDPLKNPNSYGYPTVPPNWESAATLAANKPSTQTFLRLFLEGTCGGISDDPAQTNFTVAAYPGLVGKKYGVGQEPYSYWQRGLDTYTLLMSTLDAHIGAVIKAMPDSVAQNTVILFTADHGDYVGAHGFVASKWGSCYEEVWNVPLIVVDPTGRFAGDIAIPRTQLTSAVDLMPLLVSLAYNGKRDWMKGDLAQLYHRRHDMIPMLRSAEGRGRRYVLFATDELVPSILNFNNSPLHIVGLRTEQAKIGTYANWTPLTTDIAMDGTLETEFYDYTTSDGLLELDNIPVKDSALAQAMLTLLLNDLIPNELRAPLPKDLVQPQAVSRAEYLAYVVRMNHVILADLLGGAFQTLMGIDADGM